MSTKREQLEAISEIKMLADQALAHFATEEENIAESRAEMLRWIERERQRKVAKGSLLEAATLIAANRSNVDRQRELDRIADEARARHEETREQEALKARQRSSEKDDQEALEAFEQSSAYAKAINSKAPSARSNSHLSDEQRGWANDTFAWIERKRKRGY